MAAQPSSVMRYLRKVLPVTAGVCLLIALAALLLAHRNWRACLVTCRVASDAGLPPAQARDEAVAVLRKRLEVLAKPLSLHDARVTPGADDTLELAFRTRTDLEEALFWVTMPGRAEFRLLHPDETLADAPPEDLPEGYEIATYTQYAYILARPGELEAKEHRYLLRREPLLRVRRFASVEFGAAGLHKETVMTFRLEPQDAGLFRDLTALNAGRRMALVIDGRLFLPPAQIQSAVSGGAVQVRGYFYNPPLRKLAAALNAGSLPGPLDEVSRRTQ